MHSLTLLQLFSALPGCGEFIKIRKIKSGRSNLLVTSNFYQAVEEAHERTIEAPAPQFFQKKTKK